MRTEKKIVEYFRLLPEQFVKLVDSLCPHIEKQDKNYRRSISPAENVAITLRFRVTGNSFRSLAFSYRLENTTIPDIVHSTCLAIKNTMSEQCLLVQETKDWMHIAKNV